MLVITSKKKKTLKTIGLVLRPPGGKNAFDFCGGLMANTANLHCIRKNIAHVCADGFSSSAGILVNSLVLAKMQILQNARCVWLRAGVFAIHFEHMGKEHRVASPAVLLMARASSRPTQTRAESPQQRTRATSSSQEHIPAQVVRRVATPQACLRGLRFFLMRPKTLAKTRRTSDSAFLPPCRIHVDLSSQPA